VCGDLHFCQLAGANIVRCWGDNLYGQLGRDGPASTAGLDVPMPALVVSLAAAANTTCALLATGEVRCWGDNARGQLGLPVLADTATPFLMTR
jgi:alpha-tubulin suppressor-like RCC1 family protein